MFFLSFSATRGYPVPKISWSFKNDDTAKVIKLDEANDTIVINAVTKSNTGIYTCTAYNTFGRDSHDIDVLIECKYFFNNIFTCKNYLSTQENESESFYFS